MAATRLWNKCPPADFETDQVKLYRGDCLDIMPRLPAGIFDAVITDPPFGCTANAWDRPIPVPVWWYFMDRLRKLEAIIAVCCQQTFTTELISANRPEWRYELIWHKTAPTGFLNVRKRPLRSHEHVQIFAKKFTGSVYNPQMTEGKPYTARQTGVSSNWGLTRRQGIVTHSDGRRHPRSVLQFANRRAKGQHPTQKPVDLMAWLVQTYSDSGHIVADIFMGHGTTGVACVQHDRRFVGIEKDRKYFRAAVRRIKKVSADED